MIGNDVFLYAESVKESLAVKNIVVEYFIKNLSVQGLSSRVDFWLPLIQNNNSFETLVPYNRFPVISASFLNKGRSYFVFQELVMGGPFNDDVYVNGFLDVDDGDEWKLDCARVSSGVFLEDDVINISAGLASILSGRDYTEIFEGVNNSVQRFRKPVVLTHMRRDNALGSEYIGSRISFKESSPSLEYSSLENNLLVTNIFIEDIGGF